MMVWGVVTGYLACIKHYVLGILPLTSLSSEHICFLWHFTADLLHFPILSLLHCPRALDTLFNSVMYLFNISLSVSLKSLRSFHTTIFLVVGSMLLRCATRACLLNRGCYRTPVLLKIIIVIFQQMWHYSLHIRLLCFLDSVHNLWHNREW